MAKRIQAAWHGHKARHHHEEHMRVLKIKNAAALKLQVAGFHEHRLVRELTPDHSVLAHTEVE